MTSVLFCGYAEIVLFGAINGRNIGTIAVADSYCNLKTCVTS
jgi:hypothetical protein